jgi:hypothetical protein
MCMKVSNKVDLSEIMDVYNRLKEINNQLPTFARENTKL